MVTRRKTPANRLTTAQRATGGLPPGGRRAKGGKKANSNPLSAAVANAERVSTHEREVQASNYSPDLHWEVAGVTGARVNSDGEAELRAVWGGSSWVNYKHFRDQKLALEDYEDLKERTAFSSKAAEVKQAILNVQATAKAVLDSIQYLNGSKGDTNKNRRKRSARGATKQQIRFVNYMLKCAAKNTAAIKRTHISHDDAHEEANDSDEAAEKDCPSEEEALPRSVEGADQVNEDDDDERDDIEADGPGGGNPVEERDEEDVHDEQGGNDPGEELDGEDGHNEEDDAAGQV